MMLKGFPCSLNRDRAHFLFILSVFLVFTAGFLIVYGREAGASGSWKYVITHDDEYSYWAYAKGSSQTPPSDGNPFYYEEIGRRHASPYTFANIIGWFAKVFGVPVLFFFPLWHIGMPFILWLALYFSMHKLWKYPASSSAVLSMLLLLTTLFLRGQAQFILFRFSRPGDALWMLILWISITMNRSSSLRWGVGAFFLAFGTFWLNPLCSLLGLTVTGLELFYQALKKNGWREVGGHFFPILGTLAAALSYYLYARWGADNSFRLMQELMTVYEGRKPFNFITLFFYAGITGLVFLPARALMKPLSKIDRLALFVFLIEPLTANIRLILPSNFTLGSHRYYFLIIEMACLLGLLAEKIPFLLTLKWMRRVEFYFFGFIAALGAAFLCNGKTNFFLYGPADAGPFTEWDNSLLLIGLTLFLMPGVWIFSRFRAVPKFFSRKIIIGPLLAAIGFCGFFFLPSQLRACNHAFPFDGAYAWLNEHGKKNEVVLTLGPRNMLPDYLILYTDLKTYFDRGYAQRLSVDPQAAEYRAVFSILLTLNQLNLYPIQDRRTMEEKIGRLRLDYILITLPGFLADVVPAQLAGIVEEKYRDEKCLLWKVKNNQARTGGQAQ